LFQFCDTPLDMQRRFGTTRPGPGVPGTLGAGYNAAAAVAEELGLAL
jgi:hypothetical protein